jgi:hypothetical protein
MGEQLKGPIKESYSTIMLTVQSIDYNSHYTPFLNSVEVEEVEFSLENVHQFKSRCSHPEQYFI